MRYFIYLFKNHLKDFMIDSNSSCNTNSYDQWINDLEHAVNSKDRDRLSKYYIVENFAKDGFYAITNACSYRIRMEKIVEISKEKLQTAYKDFNEGKLGGLKWIRITNRISNYTLELIQAREAKRNQKGVSIARGIALTLAAVLSFFSIKIPVLVRLQEFEHRYYEEIKKFKEDVAIPLQSYDSQSSEFCSWLSQTKINFKLIVWILDNSNNKEEFFSELDNMEKDRIISKESIGEIKTKFVELFWSKIEALQ